MTAQSAPEYDPDDPVEIMRVLPNRSHEQFLAEYDAAVTGARRPEHYRELHQLLRLWRLRAVTYADPGFATRRAATAQPTARSAAMAGATSGPLPLRTPLATPNPPPPLRLTACPS